MTYDNYRMIFMIAIIVAVIFFIVAVILFFVLKIPKVIGDLTGITERRAIRLIRLQNEKATEESEQNKNTINQKQFTDKITLSGKLIQRGGLIEAGMKTEKIDSAQLKNKNTVVLQQTEVLDDLVNKPAYPKVTTDILNADEQTDNNMNNINKKRRNDFKVEYEITFINSNEIIL